MTSQEALIGTRVSIREDYRLAHLRGRKGTIAARWGDPNYVALDVLLDDGHSELFWHHELEEIEESSIDAEQRPRNSGRSRDPSTGGQEGVSQ